MRPNIITIHDTTRGLYREIVLDCRHGTTTATVVLGDATPVMAQVIDALMVDHRREEPDCRCRLMAQA